MQMPASPIRQVGVGDGFGVCVFEGEGDDDDGGADVVGGVLVLGFLDGLADSATLVSAAAGALEWPCAVCARGRLAADGWAIGLVRTVDGPTATAARGDEWAEGVWPFWPLEVPADVEESTLTPQNSTAAVNRPSPQRWTPTDQLRVTRRCAACAG